MLPILGRGFSISLRLPIVGMRIDEPANRRHRVRPVFIVIFMDEVLIKYMVIDFFVLNNYVCLLCFPHPVWHIFGYCPSSAVFGLVCRHRLKTTGVGDDREGRGFSFE